ncbi:MAG: cache domain-containing protein, partial [Spirochaetaceae bacterium]|nr:cache domain-containing protein [Spirochaetaceae bacterium]
MAAETMNAGGEPFAPAARRVNVLARRIVLLCLSLVLVISIIFAAMSLASLANISDRNLRSTAELTMRYLNLDIQSAILPALDLTNNMAAIVPQIDSYGEMKRIFRDILPTVPATFELYYGTTVSRFEGGSFVAATDWDPYTTNPAWDQVKRPWFITSMENPGKRLITDPYEDSSTGKTCVSVVKTVETGGKIIGVVGVDVFLDVLVEIVAGHRITSDGHTFIIDKEGLYLVHENTDYVMQKNFFEIEGKDLKKDIAASPDAQVAILGNTYWASMPVSGLDWIMISTGSTAEMEQDFWQSLIFTIITVLV